jgi:hypothetical protein
MRKLRVLILYAMAALSGAAIAADDETLTKGPVHYCGWNFSADLAADEQMAWQQGPDFLVYRLQSPRGGFGIYEGFYPDIFENSRETIAIPGYRKVERLRAKDGSYSYLIEAPAGSPQAYVHLWGQVWKGSAADLPLLRRIKVGGQQDLHCSRPTVQPPSRGAK